MKSVIVVVMLIINFYKNIRTQAFYTNSTCGLDKSPVSMVYEGMAAIETYPWMGMLYYPMEKKRFTTSVVLVTRQMVIAAASEIDKLPKIDFRIRTRVILGQKCEGGYEIKVRDYTFHPDYEKYSFSALAMVQLEIDHIKIELRPICQPPAHFLEPHFFAMTMSEGCKNPKIRIHRMQYVSLDRCKNFYRRSGLGQDSFWPTHTACARAISGGRCVWRSGSVLTVKQDGRWRLLGFSVYGPGCGAPARFLDYGMYHQWVRTSSTTIGLPAISRLGDNHLVMRRSLSNVQRFGPCDPEETKGELYTDKVKILFQKGQIYHAKYNVSLYANVEYSCIVFKAQPLTSSGKIDPKDEAPEEEHKLPKIRLRRWCATPRHMCYGFQHLEIQFYVDISFTDSVVFTVMAYGREAKVISPNVALKYANVNNATRPVIPTYEEVLTLLREWKDIRKHRWFYLEDIRSINFGKEQLTKFISKVQSGFFQNL